MSFTPYDWNQSIQTRSEYIEERLREGSPAVALSLPGGILLATIHSSRRKIYEVYDRLVFTGTGHAGDVEAIRIAAIDFAHREGFQRSPEDVTLFRLIGSVLSPALKKAFGDPFTVPLIFRGLFAEVHDDPAQDQFYTLDFDGEYRSENRFSLIAGSCAAENKMTELIGPRLEEAEDLQSALRLALEAWALGRHAGMPSSRGDSAVNEFDAGEVLREALREGRVEAAWMDRTPRRERRFRLLTADELAPALPADR